MIHILLQADTIQLLAFANGYLYSLLDKKCQLNFISPLLIYFVIINEAMDLESFRYQFRKVLKDIPKICLLGVRDYTDNKTHGEAPNNIYDDAIISHVDGFIKIFTASVDPGSYFINDPINPQGCARLKCGLWSYQLGEHHAHKALVQAEEVGVDRLDKQGKRVSEEHGWFGINLHSGGPEYLVGRYSAGCQVIKTSETWKDEWLDFFTPIKVGVEFYGQKKIPYLLVDRLEAIPADVEPSLNPS